MLTSHEISGIFLIFPDMRYWFLDIINYTGSIEITSSSLKLKVLYIDK